MFNGFSFSAERETLLTHPSADNCCLDVACAALHYWTLQAASSLSGGWTDTLVIL